MIAMIRVICLAICFAPATALAQPPARNVSPRIAGEAHFIFTVPVAVQNLHADVDAAAMECRVGQRNVPGWIGESIQTFPLDAQGSHAGNVLVRVQASTGKDPAAADFYDCALVLRRKGTTEWVHADPQGEAWLKPKPGAQFVSGSQGDIP
ncbi:MAG: hypothetical protein ABR559_01495 [Gemmatimonadota bacterium]